MNLLPPLCLCGFSQEQLICVPHLIGDGGECTAWRKGSKKTIRCGELVSEHHRQSVQIQPPLLDDLRIQRIATSVFFDRIFSKKSRGVSTYAQWTQEMRSKNHLIVHNDLTNWLEVLQRRQENWWPTHQVAPFPPIGAGEKATCQPYVTAMIEHLTLKKKHCILPDGSGYDQIGLDIDPPPPNDIVDRSSGDTSFSSRKPDIVMYKNNQRGPCSITMLGDVKGRSTEGSFPDEQIGHILDMTQDLMSDHQFSRQFIYSFLTDGYRFQFFRCLRFGDDFRFHSSTVYIGESGWQILFALQAETSGDLGLVMDHIEGWSLIRGLGVGRFSRVYEVGGFQSSLVAKYFSNPAKGAHERDILERLWQFRCDSIPIVCAAVVKINYYALIVSPVGIPIIEASQEHSITPNMIIALLRVLETAHGFGLIHRDVKPENIFLDKNDHNQIILNDWSSAAAAGVACDYEGTPLYGDHPIPEIQQVPTRKLDLRCFVKTVFTIKQQKYPRSNMIREEIEDYWRAVSNGYPHFQIVLNYAESESYADLERSFREVWF